MGFSTRMVPSSTHTASWFFPLLTISVSTILCSSTTFWRLYWTKLLYESSWWRATCSWEKYAPDNTLLSIMIFTSELFLWPSYYEAVGRGFACSLAFSYDRNDVSGFCAAGFYSGVIMIDFWKMVFRYVEG